MSLVAEVELAGATRIVVAGSGEAARALVRVAAEEYVPGKVLLAIDPEQEGGRELLRRLNCPARERATAYVCPKRECLRPVREAGKLVEMLKGL